MRCTSHAGGVGDRVADGVAQRQGAGPAGRHLVEVHDARAGVHPREDHRAAGGVLQERPLGPDGPAAVLAGAGQLHGRGVDAAERAVGVPAGHVVVGHRRVDRVPDRQAEPDGVGPGGRSGPHHDAQRGPRRRAGRVGHLVRHGGGRADEPGHGADGDRPVGGQRPGALRRAPTASCRRRTGCSRPAGRRRGTPSGRGRAAPTLRGRRPLPAAGRPRPAGSRRGRRSRPATLPVTATASRPCTTAELSVRTEYVTARNLAHEAAGGDEPDRPGRRVDRPDPLPGHRQPSGRPRSPCSPSADLRSAASATPGRTRPPTRRAAAPGRPWSAARG